MRCLQGSTPGPTVRHSDIRTGQAALNCRSKAVMLSALLGRLFHCALASTSFPTPCMAVRAGCACSMLELSQESGPRSENMWVSSRDHICSSLDVLCTSRDGSHFRCLVCSWVSSLTPCSCGVMGRLHVLGRCPLVPPAWTWPLSCCWSRKSAAGVPTFASPTSHRGGPVVGAYCSLYRTAFAVGMCAVPSPTGSAAWASPGVRVLPCLGCFIAASRWWIWALTVSCSDSATWAHRWAAVAPSPSR